ncbi:transient receptor potential cation channel subfamily V member 6, partial [Elysia marginata]
ESALHLAIVVGDLESVQLLVKAGANVNQRASGRFFLPEDQKKGVTDRTDYDGYAYYGEYPLAFAACFGNTDMYDFLLEYGADPNLQDSFGNTVLHMVVISNQSDMYRYAVRHHKRPANTSIQNKQKLTPLTLACKLGRHAIFKEMLDLDSINSHHFLVNFQEFWRFSTTMCSAHPLRTLDSIGPDGSTNWNSALMIIVNGDKDDHLEMLEGGVIRQLLGEKWKTFAQSRFIVRLILAFIHLTLFSIAIYTRPSGGKLLGYNGITDVVRYTCEAAVCFSCLVTVVYEVLEISKQGIMSFIKNCTHAPAQTVHLISCLLILACVPFRVFGFDRVEDILLILAAPCAWFFLLFFARGQQRFGPFVTMIYKMIAGDLFRFGIIYFIFLIGFTQGFYFLFKDVTPTGDDVANFSTLPETILNLFQMTLGEFKYEVFSYSHHAWLTKIIFALFMILVPILLLNMLIAMMGNTYTQVISKSTKEWWKQWAKIVVVLERGVSKKKLLEYQSSYSVELAGAPPSDDGSPAPPAERALVVIKLSKKSRAKTRKGAVFRWKWFGKEIIRQLRLRKKDGEPFVLQESARRMDDQSSDAMLTSTVAQLAWERDIDLTKGLQGVSPSSPLPSPSHTGPQFLEEEPPRMMANGNALKASSGIEISNVVEDRLPSEIRMRPTLQGDPTVQIPKNVADASTPALKRKKNLVYNRVSPLSLGPGVPGDAVLDGAFSDLSEAPAHRGFQSGDSSRDKFQFPSSASYRAGSGKEGSPTRNVVISDEPNNRIVQSEFSFSASSDTGCDTQPLTKPRRRTVAGKQLERAESARELKGREDLGRVVDSRVTSPRRSFSTAPPSRDVEVAIPGVPQEVNLAGPSGATCWTEDSSEVTVSQPRSKKKRKKQRSQSKSTKSGTGSADSGSSLLHLDGKSPGDKDSHV